MSSEEETGKEKPFLCTFDLCRASFSKNRKLVNHVRRHKGERPFACDAPGCEKTYTNSSHLLRHKRVFHENQKEEVPCPHEGCSKVLSSKWNLKKHVTRAHNPDRKYPYECSQCKRGFSRKIFLKQHMSEHTGEAPYKCKKCKSTFLTKAQRNRHERTHVLYHCLCGENYERWSLLLKHRKTCEECVSLCEICHKKFKNLQNLKHHLTVHEQLENRTVHFCEFEGCNRFYFYRNNLIQHVSDYHKKEVKKFKCAGPGCGKVFVRKTNLNSHIMKVHVKTQDCKEKKKMRARKDKGIPKKSALSQLLGLNLPKDQERLLMNNKEEKKLVPKISSEKEDQQSKEIGLVTSDVINVISNNLQISSCAREVGAISESDISDGELMRRCEIGFNLVK